MLTTLVITVIALALIFDFINGFHDAANAITTIVFTRVLTPFQAVLWATTFNFAAYFVFTDHKIANTVAKIVTDDFVTLHVILAGLVAAISWNLLTWWYGIPSSSSHTLIGGFVGAGVAHAQLIGADPIQAVHLHYVMLILSCIVLAPLIGLAIAYCITHAINYLTRNTSEKAIDRGFRFGQLISSAALSFAHGGNDAQKVMGIIYITMVTAQVIAPDSAMPGWIPLSCYSVIALGTMAGGWRIVKTMGSKITRITPLKGVSAESAGAITLLITEHFGIPVSTTHTITGSIIGVGLTKDVAAVRWGTIRNMLLAWVMTIPVSAFIAGSVYSLIHYAGWY